MYGRLNTVIIYPILHLPADDSRIVEPEAVVEEAQDASVQETGNVCFQIYSHLSMVVVLHC